MTIPSKKAALEVENPNTESLAAVIQSIHDLYGTKNPAQAFELLRLVENMLQAKTCPELKTATNKVISTARSKTTFGCICPCLFTPEKTQLAKLELAQ